MPHKPQWYIYPIKGFFFMFRPAFGKKDIIFYFDNLMNKASLACNHEIG